MAPEVEVFIGLGSNLGDPKANLASARKALEALEDLDVLAWSSPWRTAPVGPQDQPPFCNAVARGIYRGAPLDLLDALLAIERDHGRQRRERWGPRTLDLDLLLFGREVIESPRLTVPHPEMSGRVFVLAPLKELAPELVLPVWGKTAGQLLCAMDPDQRQAQSAERIAWDSST